MLTSPMCLALFATLATPPESEPISAPEAAAPGFPTEPTTPEAIPLPDREPVPGPEPESPQPPPAPAPEPKSDEGTTDPDAVRPTRRRPGPYVRVGLGPGYATGKTDNGIHYDGVAGAFLLNVGAEVGAGVAVHFDFFATSKLWLRNDLEADGLRVDSLGVFAAGFVGGGLTYHLMPYDLYLGAGAGLSMAGASRLSVATLDGEEVYTAGKVGSTKPGFAFHATVGKLFGIAPRWALGPSFQYAYMGYGTRPEYDVNLVDTHVFWLACTAAFGN